MKSIKIRTLGLGVAALLAAPLLACASQPPSELVTARATYNEVSAGVASEMAPAELHDAQKALAAAEHAFSEEGDDWATRSKAYIATRKAETARVIAETRVQEKQIEGYAQEREALQEQLRREATRELGQKSEQLEETQDELASERTARVQAEVEATQAKMTAAEAQARYDAAMKKLGEIAQMHEGERGLVISLSSGVIFATGKSELRSPAYNKLNDVVEVLKSQPDRKVEIEGHTDNVGSDGFNMTLSQDRADAVRNYLIQQGIEATRVTARGMGETNPVATNETVEGRANNRRVDIILKPLPIDIEE